MYQPQNGYQFIHGIYIPPSDQNPNDALCAVIKHKDTNEVKIQCLPNPKMKVWIMKKSLQNYEERLEAAPLNQLDEFVCSYKNLSAEVAQHLGYKSGKFINPRTITANPFVFGLDVEPLVRMKQEYLNATPGLIHNLSYGSYDLEVSVLGTNEILCSSFVDWDRKIAYCHINAKWYDPKDNWQEHLDKLFLEKKDEAYSQMNDKAKKLFEFDKWQCHFIMCQNERELILKTWQVIHASKVVFLGIWNSTYDIPKTIERANFNMINLTDLFCSPEVPKEWRYFKYHEDNRKHEHFTDRWDVLDSVAYFYAIDQMCLYSRTRKVKGREPSYGLDFICRKLTGIGKIGLEDTGDHYLMQTKHKAHYCVYNVFDSIDVGLINAITDDITGMLSTQGPSLIRDLSKQTVSLVHQLYKYSLEHNKVPGSAGHISMRGQFDEVIGNVGGAVLDSNKLKTQGWPCLKETNEGTWLRKLACDIDVSSFYPSMDIAGNMSRATKLSTVLWVEGAPYDIETVMNAPTEKDKEAMRKKNAEYIDTLFGKVPYVSENCVSICKDHFNLFSYSDAIDLYVASRSNVMNNQYL